MGLYPTQNEDKSVSSTVQSRSTFFYADKGSIALTQSELIQGEFDTLTGMFDQVGLQTNVGKTARMLFRTCCAVVTELEAPYKRRMMGGGLASGPSRNSRSGVHNLWMNWRQVLW